MHTSGCLSKPHKVIERRTDNYGWPPDSCDTEHLASDNLLGRIERSIQSLNGLQQNSFFNAKALLV